MCPPVTRRCGSAARVQLDDGHQIQIEKFDEIVVRGVFDARSHARAGIVDHRVDAAESLDCGCHESLDRCLVGHIGWLCEHLTAEVTNRERRLVQLFDCPCSKHDRCASASEGLGQHAAESCRRTGNHYHLFLPIAHGGYCS